MILVLGVLEAAAGLCKSFKGRNEHGAAQQQDLERLFCWAIELARVPGDCTRDHAHVIVVHCTSACHATSSSSLPWCGKSCNFLKSQAPDCLPSPECNVVSTLDGPSLQK